MSVRIVGSPIQSTRCGVAGLGWLGIESSKATAQVNHASKPAQSILIGGEPVVTLRRPEVSDRSKPQFLDACILPGRGMASSKSKLTFR